MSPRLAVTGLTGGRGETVAFRNVDLEVADGRILALLGPNGAGKTTLLLTIAGLLPPRKGQVLVDGVRVRGGRPHLANVAGVVLVPDTRHLFPSLSVEENLEVAVRKGGPAPRDMVEIFPALEPRWDLRAAALSGGEQQMLTVARALIQQPKVLLLDELSMGLAPLIVETLFETVQRTASDLGCAVVLVEQHVDVALSVADEAAVLSHGSLVLRGDAARLRSQPDLLEHAYFGTLPDASSSPRSQ